MKETLENSEQKVEELKDQREALKAEIKDMKLYNSMAPISDIDKLVHNFIYTVRPRLSMGELQVVAVLAIYLKSGNSKDIPGYRDSERAVTEKEFLEALAK